MSQPRGDGSRTGGEGARAERAGSPSRALRRLLGAERAAGSEARIRRRWERTLRILRSLAPVSEGNRIRVFTDGDGAFEAMWAAIESAREGVLLDTYAFLPDAVGVRTRDLLADAARRGCRVQLVYDAFGSSRLGPRFLQPLRAAGVEVFVYNPLLRLRSPISRLVRNHKKILVVDGETGFCGGMNVAADYAGEKHGTHRFRDTHVRLRGPGVHDLAAPVRGLIEELGGTPLPLGRVPPPLPDGAPVQVLESNVRRERRAIQRAMRVTVARAVETCYLTTPYFVPPRRLVRDLRRAARRGVDVRVLTAGPSDVPIVRLASRHLYGRLLRSGVRIWELQGRMLHAKTAVVDGVYAQVGSFNLDSWSYHRNLEVGLSIPDAGVARRLREQFEEDLAGSAEVRLADWERRSWWERLVQWAAYQLLRL